MSKTARRLTARLLVAVIVIAAGLALREFTTGPVAKYGGVALYAVLVYVLVAAVRPKASPGRVFVIVFVICVAVEFFQLTPVPARLAAEHRFFGLVLGTTFHWLDLLAYGAGALGAALVHKAVRSR